MQPDILMNNCIKTRVVSFALYLCMPSKNICRQYEKHNPPCGCKPLLQQENGSMFTCMRSRIPSSLSDESTQNTKYRVA